MASRPIEVIDNRNELNTALIIPDVLVDPETGREYLIRKWAPIADSHRAALIIKAVIVPQQIKEHNEQAS